MSTFHDFRKNIPVSIRLPVEMVNKIDRLVKAGLWPSRSEFIREAIRRYLIEIEHKLRRRGGELEDMFESISLLNI